ncbi:MAG: hypothetical protein HRT73_11385 [Flavobacteriales bacterium]|nr:hypothetical protein [Flavobacteriales bacterium]
MKKLFFIVLGFAVGESFYAQNVGINGTGAAPNASAILDIAATNKGILIPRLALTAINSNAPIGGGVTTSLLVYNTVSAGTGINVVTPGFYYWNGTIWVRFINSKESWETLGNTGTVAGTNFIGTTDAVDLVVKTAGTERMRVNGVADAQVGFIGIGTSGPQALLHTDGGDVVMVGANGNIADIGAADVLAVTDATKWPINAYATGTNAGAGFFKISNAANVKPVIDIKNAGTGEGILSTSIGTGIAFRGQSSTATTIGLFTNNNNGNNIDVVDVQYNGTGTSSNVAIRGTSNSAGAGNGTGVIGDGGFIGVRGFGGTYAGYFNGNVRIIGSITKSSGTFLIDHPLDPANKFLYHSFVESPDMMNVYNGNTTTDGNGLATVILPEYFEALNMDYRYQLTVIGKFAQVIVFKKVNNNKFIIKSNIPNVEVSWQVTGIRNDKYAQKNRVVPEVEKEGEDKGKYLHPEVFGLPESQGLDYDEIYRDKTKVIEGKGKEE